MRLSAKHGLNPSMPVCFWCGEPTGEVVWFGASYPKGAEAPMHVVMNYNPCPKCVADFAKGIVLMAASHTPIGNRPAIQDGVWPTGAVVVVTEEAVRHIFKGDAADDVLKHRRAYLDAETFDALFRGEAEDGKDGG